MVKNFIYQKKKYSYKTLADKVNTETKKGNLDFLDTAIEIVQKQRSKGKVAYEDENDFWNNLDTTFSTIKLKNNDKWRLTSYKLYSRQSITEFLLNKIRDFHDAEILMEPREEEEIVDDESEEN